MGRAGTGFANMTYSVKEIFYSLQGEGAHSGRPAVFCRFSGCNLWNGIEADRDSSVCSFCDTDFIGVDGVGGKKFKDADQLAKAVRSAWKGSRAHADERYVVCTGGEPMLQLGEELVEAFHKQGFTVAVETNGTIPLCEGIDWVCVSPKEGSELLVKSGDEIKVVYPQFIMGLGNFEALDFKFFYLQPMDGPQMERNTQMAIQYCLKHPKWRLSTQTHKHLGIQ